MTKQNKEMTIDIEMWAASASYNKSALKLFNLNFN